MLEVTVQPAKNWEHQDEWRRLQSKMTNNVGKV